jgi:hypothetical protein
MGIIIEFLHPSYCAYGTHFTLFIEAKVKEELSIRKQDPFLLWLAGLVVLLLLLSPSTYKKPLCCVRRG